MSERSLDDIYLLIVDVTKSIGQVQTGQESLRGEMKEEQANARSEIARVGRRVDDVDKRLGNGHGLESRIAEIETWVRTHPTTCFFLKNKEEREKEEEDQVKEVHREFDRRKFDKRMALWGAALAVIFGLIQWGLTTGLERRFDAKYNAVTPAVTQP